VTGHGLHLDDEGDCKNQGHDDDDDDDKDDDTDIDGFLRHYKSLH